MRHSALQAPRAWWLLAALLAATLFLGCALAAPGSDSERAPAAAGAGPSSGSSHSTRTRRPPEMPFSKFSSFAASGTPAQKQAARDFLNLTIPVYEVFSPAGYRPVDAQVVLRWSNGEPLAERHCLWCAAAPGVSPGALARVALPGTDGGAGWAWMRCPCRCGLARRGAALTAETPRPDRAGPPGGRGDLRAAAPAAALAAPPLRHPVRPGSAMRRAPRQTQPTRFNYCRPGVGLAMAQTMGKNAEWSSFELMPEVASELAECSFLQMLPPPGLAERALGLPPRCSHRGCGGMAGDSEAGAGPLLRCSGRCRGAAAYCCVACQKAYERRDGGEGEAGEGEEQG
ncbi:hypothetical protein HYH03_004703 [Edaphochlamys debaryana]|uniref:Uncharacterized protein n=1 Tax=Edaphochlamys debaryana TaxID=47281 RepID=A0A836C2S6_9CHLO|nr:hypothetical protein HYH03_004703 [Edaphochlamys debaryana]|eukprot:KAG2497112.1 hypothetical protein HYH03_004703 [Edaphochlamys debaryana]